MALFALPLAVRLIGWRMSTARWRVDSPGLLGGGQGFLLGAFVGVTKPAEQAASPVLMGCTSAVAFPGTVACPQRPARSRSEGSREQAAKTGRIRGDRHNRGSSAGTGATHQRGLRHCLTDYEEHLFEIAGRVGVRDGYVAIKTKVLRAIAEAYDCLKEECRRPDKEADS
jgi:hypothetical protein